MRRDGFTYATREDVKNALDVLETSRADTQIDRVLRSSSDSIEGLLRRRFYPEKRTQTFDWPLWDNLNRSPWRLYLDQHELISVETLVSGGETISASDYFLRPDDGPPFRRIEMDLAGAVSSFNSGDTHQRSISVTGTFGYSADTDEAGLLDGGVNNLTTEITGSDGSLIGVGDLLLIGTERMVVQDRRFTASGATLGANVSQAGTNSITVSDGTLLNYGETLLIGAERMLITDIVGNTVAVKRAWDGTALESHTSGDVVYVSRRFVVLRGALGTTATSHSDSDVIEKHSVPPLVRDLCIAEAMARLVQERTGYARTIGAGEGEREVRGVGLADLRELAIDQYGRQSRMRSV